MPIGGEVTRSLHLSEKEFLMFTPLALAFLIFGSAVEADSAPSAQAEPLRVSVGGMSFSGNTIKLRKSDKETFECEIDGRAEFALGSGGDTDIAIAAQKIVVSRNADSEITIRCSGDCKMKDIDDTSCSADRMLIQLGKQTELQMSGSSRVEYGDGDGRTILTSESLTFQGGKFIVSGPASLSAGARIIQIAPHSAVEPCGQPEPPITRMP